MENELKDITDINLKTLETAVNAAITGMVGGDVTVRIFRWQSFPSEGGEMEIVFRVFDQSFSERPIAALRTSWQKGEL